MSKTIGFCKFCNGMTDGSEFCSDICKKEFYLNIDQEDTVSCDRCNSSEDVETIELITGEKTRLCPKCLRKFKAQISNDIEEFVGMEQFELAAKHILQGLMDMGFELDYDNFHDTPKRFARAYREIFSGCSHTQDQVDAILSTSFPAQGAENMVVAKDIVCFSMCPHHLLPVEYHVCVGYIPKKGGDVLGISKLSRLVTVLAKRPALQETFTQDIVNALDSIGCQGAIAVAEGQHMCMRMRGARAINSTITTSSVSGYFIENPSTKEEFLKNIEDRMKFKG